MQDPRFDALAKQLVTYSLNVQSGEKIFIDATDIPDEMTIALIRMIRNQDAIPFVRINHLKVNSEMLRESTDDQYDAMCRFQLPEIREMDGFIAMRGKPNSFEMASVPAEKLATAMKHLRPVSQYRIDNTRWCVADWPSPSMAQAAGMSTEQFEDFYFNACLADYAAMAVHMRKLAAIMKKSEQVRITGPGTDLSFSIKGINSVPCVGDRNIPDGEVYTAPVRNSVNGRIQYNVPTVFQGTPFDSIAFVVEEGKIIEATAGSKAKTELLNKILDTDEGARYFGEFSFGTNPMITTPMCNILFDEKIAGSFHMTPGQAYSIADNGNKSQIHWDLVCLQTPEFGGGEIYMNGELFRKDGKFIDPDLAELNPVE